MPPFKHSVTTFFKTPYQHTFGLLMTLLNEYLPAVHYTTVQPTDRALLSPICCRLRESKNNFQCQQFFFLFGCLPTRVLLRREGLNYEFCQAIVTRTCYVKRQTFSPVARGAGLLHQLKK